MVIITLNRKEFARVSSTGSSLQSAKALWSRTTKHSRRKKRPQAYTTNSFHLFRTSCVITYSTSIYLNPQIPHAHCSIIHPTLRRTGEGTSDSSDAQHVRTWNLTDIRLQGMWRIFVNEPFLLKRRIWDTKRYLQPFVSCASCLLIFLKWISEWLVYSFVYSSGVSLLTGRFSPDPSLPWVCFFPSFASRTRWYSICKLGERLWGIPNIWPRLPAFTGLHNALFYILCQ